MIVTTSARPLFEERPKDLDAALHFVLQSHERLLEQKRAEGVVRRVLRPSHSVIKHAETATMDAANTMDAAVQEFCDTLRDMTTKAIMAAIAAIPE